MCFSYFNNRGRPGVPCLGIFFSVFFLAGCAAGPDLHQAEMTSPETYTADALPAATASAAVLGGASQRFVRTEKIPADWWAMFRCRELDLLIRQALEGNPTLVAAQATLRAAEEDYNAKAGGIYYPDLSAGLSSTRLKTSPASLGQTQGKGSNFNLHNASLNAGYSFDFFGSGRRELESLKARIDYQHYQLKAADLTIAANVALAAFKEASLRARIKASQEIIANLERHFDLIEKQFSLGGVARSEVLAQQALLEQTRAGLPSLQKELAQTRHALVVLAGKFPVDVGTLPVFELEMFTLPEALPLSLPSTLALQRPDIQAAEALMHSASAQAGVAAANMYPRITLSASFGTEALDTGKLFDLNNTVWNIGSGIFQPVFNGGTLRARRRGAIDIYNQAAALYRQTVLSAFENVADVLKAVESDAMTLSAQAESEAAARASLELTQKQFQSGAINFVLLLNVESQYQQAKIGLIQAQAARLMDTAALFQSLGGGWQK